MMATPLDLEHRIQEIRTRYGDWTYDIPLPHGVWTRGNEGVPHTRLKRLLQATSDLSRKPLADCRVLDLGCLDGQFSIEFALQGAAVLGLDAREANLEKARFAKEVLGLDRLELIRDDARNISVERYGRFDVVVCSGLLYHLNTPDVFQLVERMAGMLDNLLLIDTHISLTPATTVPYEGRVYHGHYWREHDNADTDEQKAARLLASWENDLSFMLTRPSLVNLLAHVGFSSVYECFTPAHLNFGRPGLEYHDRCTIVAIKGQPVRVHTSPAANDLHEDHPEESLSYPVRTQREGTRPRSALDRLRRKVKSLRKMMSPR